MKLKTVYCYLWKRNAIRNMSYIQAFSLRTIILTVCDKEYAKLTKNRKKNSGGAETSHQQW